MGIVKSLERGFRLFAGSLEEGIEFGKKSLLDVLKYYIVSTLAMLAPTTLGAGLALLAVLAFGQYSVIAIVLAVFLALAGAFIGAVYSLAAGFGAIEFIYHKKRVGYFEQKNVNVAIKWVLFVIGAIIALGVLSLLASLLVTYLFSDLAIFFLILAILVSVFAILVLAFIMYYVGMELAIKKLGPIAAIKGSYRLVRGNFWETLVFAVGMFMLIMIAQIPAQIVIVIMDFLGQILIMASGGLAMVAGIGMVALAFVLSVIVSLVMSAGAIIVTVNFYKKITEDKIKTKKAS